MGSEMCIRDSVRMGRISVSKPHAPAAVDLAFEVVAVMTWDVHFLSRTISVWRSFLRKGLEREEILSVDSRALNENTKMWRKVLEKIIHTTNCK